MVDANAKKGTRRARQYTASNASFNNHGMEHTKLLGAMFNDRNDMAQEVTSRIMSIREATGPMRRS
eukprot:7470066-Pyramimonas_sp.AAC.1